MWPVQIVVDAPFLDDLAGMAEAAEEVLVEALVPQPSIEALDQSVLHRLARRDEFPFMPKPDDPQEPRHDGRDQRTSHSEL